MKKLISILIFLPLLSTGQTKVGFIKTFGGSDEMNMGYMMALTDSTFIVSGSRGGDTYLFCIDVMGNILWEERYGVGLGRVFSMDYPNEIRLVGVSSNDAFYLKTTLNGDSILLKKYGGQLFDGAVSIAVLQSGNNIILGTTESFGFGVTDYYVIKTNSAGDTIWTKTFGGPYLDYGQYIFNYSDTTLCLFGGLGNDIGGEQVYIVVIDTNGNELYTKKYSNFGGLAGTNLSLELGSIIAGNGSRAKLFKLDANLDSIWLKSFDPSNIRDFRWALTLQDNSIVASGQAEDQGMGENDAYLVKVDSIGNILWERFYGFEFDDIGKTCSQTKDGGFLWACETKTGLGAAHDIAMIIKTDSNGCVWYPSAHFSASTNSLILGDTLWLADSSKVLAEDSLHRLLWDFGDGNTTDTTKHPYHVYQSAGDYTVSLEAFNLSGCSDVAQYSVFVKDTTTTVNTIPSFENSLDVSIIPNPFIDHTTIKLGGGNSNHHYTYSLYNTLGEKVRQARFTGTTTTLNRAQLPKGVYFLQFQGDNGQSMTRKLVIQ